MLRFIDLLYGQIELPEWILPFVKLPEFIRLRGVRLSNVDSVYFKDFSGPARWEHGIAVAALAYRCAHRRGISERERIQLVLAALLHDIGTPPFAHTAESVLANFDHELEGQRLLAARQGDDFSPDVPVFQSQLPQFQRACERLSRQLHIRVDADEVAKCIAGEGELGFLINGPIDLDNADNVTRASLFLGLKVRADVPLGVTDWLACQEGVVTDLEAVNDEFVQEWVGYRSRLYTAFFEADEMELGRTAFLQHLMRRGLDAGLERSNLIWATDEELMGKIAQIDDTAPDDFRPALSELAQRYRLLETPICVATVPINDHDTLRTLRHPDAVAWITRHLRSERFEPMVLVMARRFALQPKSLLPELAGTLFVFHLGSHSRVRDFSTRLQSYSRNGDSSTGNSIDTLLARAVRQWVVDKPWTEPNHHKKRNVRTALQSVGDWGFRLSRNDSFHAYPSTFVHALPANLLVALGVRDDVVLDPFGGTGQTALEAVKYGNTAVSADVNTIACLVAKARLTFMPATTRARIRALDETAIRESRRAQPPTSELLDEWFHPQTTEELTCINGFIDDRHDPVLQTLLRACLSAILPACTARKGEQHGYFADNCPLPKDVEAPPYRAAIRMFLEKTAQALSRAERLYGYLQRQGRNPEVELARVTVRQANVRMASAASYDLRAGEVGAIITSPPYLCMADYSLGQRLSYEWLAPSLLESDFSREVGARRLRLKTNQREQIVAEYRSALNSFGALAGGLIRKGGFVAVVLGQPLANQYRDTRVIAFLDKALEENGFERIWETERPIHWHRNHGYARLKKERISVHGKL